ncbi:hypothetical protein HYH03_014935 [Edaphochlamys debaryana]|uniref:RING-type domain-containing protein n=1 Tax=Edaphochlamys debaryana TaxID=47281 RepID=A0A836BT04_9CHLO|nr:hypothetical protein HYH03_014935 [Edaphochlamys debaryana]|eukprot:KAG2486354.1 hypothetical protein HYH03_014935 [Edaphochlamys debaryana]
MSAAGPVNTGAPQPHPFAIGVEQQAAPIGAQPATQAPGNADASTSNTSSSAATLPRLASVRVSNSGSSDSPERERERTEAGDAGAGPGPARQPTGASDVLGPDADADTVVLTPSRLRLDSRVVLLHATFQWLTNAVWALLIWLKLEGTIGWSWWAVWSPTILNHALHIPLQIVVFASANYMVYKQIGPPPPPSATPGLVLQYAIIRHVRVRSHRVDWANGALESTALFIVKMLFCNALESGRLGSTSLRLLLTPVWAVWVLSVALLCLKDRTERMFGSSRDLFFIFLLFVAFKVDEQSSYSWRVVFLVPWMWFSGLLLVAAMVLLLLLFAKVWARPRELLLPLGFVCLLLATLPQFFSYIALVRRLDGDLNTSLASIMWPNALSWALMWLSALLISWALRQKEAVRDGLLARGAVWTAHEAVARRLHAERDEAQRRVDELSEEEVSRLVAGMMAGKAKPGRLRRVGATLYKRMASLEPALAEQAAQGAMAASASVSSRSGRVHPVPFAFGLGPGGGAGAGLGAPGASPLAAAGAGPGAAPPGVHPLYGPYPGGPALLRSASAPHAGAAAGLMRPPLVPQPDPSGPEGQGAQAHPGPHPMAALAAAGVLGPGRPGSGRGPRVGAPEGPGLGGAPPLRPLGPLGPAAALGLQRPPEGAAVGAAGAGGAGDSVRQSAALGPLPAAASAGGAAPGAAAAAPSAAAASVAAPEAAAAAGRPGRFWRPASAPHTGRAGAGGVLGLGVAAAEALGLGLGPGRPGPAAGAGPGAGGASRLGVVAEGDEGAEGAAAGPSSAAPRRPASLNPDGASAGGAAEGSGRGAGASGAAAAGPRSSGGGAAGSGAGAEAGAGSGPGPGSGSGGGAEGEDGDDCIICYAAAATCVFLECGHGGFCRRCAHLLFIRPPNECPTCRSRIEQVVEIEAVAPVGEVARVL